MPQYYFDIETDGRLEPDAEGVSIEDETIAKREAIKALFAFAKENGTAPRSWTIRSKVRDSDDRLVFEANLSLAVAELGGR